MAASPAFHRRRPDDHEMQDEKKAAVGIALLVRVPLFPFKGKYEPFAQPGHPPQRAAFEGARGGATDRRTNGLARRTLRSVSPFSSRSRCSA